MESIREQLHHVDHTLLTQTATWEEIRVLCDEAMEYGTASVCIPPSYVVQAREYVGGRMAVCTVIGFPNGYQTTPVKVYEAGQALTDGADEIDMVINLGWVKDGKFHEIEDEIHKVKTVCGDKILKVIVETCLLTEEEKIKLCDVVTSSGADFIKTSTGFSSGGATAEDIQLFADYVGPEVMIKAAGGIHSLEDSRHFLELGADRLGSSRMVQMMREREEHV